MARRDPERLEKLKIAVRYLLSNGTLERGHQTRLAEHFDVSRQWVHKIVAVERQTVEAHKPSSRGA